jgi:AraC family transcriptional regulator, positive regulator of tynA and feaB
MMDDTSGSRRPATLSSDEWISQSRLVLAYDPVGVDPGAFVGWLRPFSLFGMQAFDWACNVPRIDRTQQHTRIDGLEDFSALFPLTGRSALDHNKSLLELGVGDVILLDPTRPGTVVREHGVARHLLLHLPRRELVSHLGFEPAGGLLGRKGVAGRLLFQLISEAVGDQGELSDAAEPHMRLAIYDLLAAVFSTSEQRPASAHTDKLFASICHMIRNQFTDPHLSPSSVAADAGLSLRYLQKLFTARGMTCGDFIHSLRLDHASRLIARRVALQSDQPLSDVAQASGFLDYAHFSRKFRARFGHPPSLHLTSERRK